MGRLVHTGLGSSCLVARVLHLPPPHTREQFCNRYYSNKHTTHTRWAGGWACTSHPGVLGSIPKPEEPGKTGRHPVLKYRVPHGSQMVGIKSSDGLVVGLAPATLEFWVRFPNERNQGKQCGGRHPVLKYWVPHGSHFIKGATVINTYTALYRILVRH